MTRKYEQRKRADQQEETRQRIVRAAVELHELLGPSRTTVSAVAERAGVQRATFYRHFPDDRTLITACSGLYTSENPLPDPATWTDLDAGTGRPWRWASCTRSGSATSRW